jgi:hypothetical protein
MEERPFLSPLPPIFDNYGGHTGYSGGRPIIPDSLVGFPLGRLTMNRRNKKHRCLLHSYSRPRTLRPRLDIRATEEERHFGPGALDGAVFDWLERNECFVIGERVRFADPELDAAAADIAIERDFEYYWRDTDT